jgi:hypothetical protein
MSPSKAPSTSEILTRLVERPEPASLHFDDLVEAFGRRAFGALLVIACVPAFIPVPFGVGAISGVLVAAVGLQMLLCLRQPWLPQRLRTRNLPRARLRSFNQRMGGALAKLERLCRPRLNGLAERAASGAFTGLQLVLLGLLMALPIPFTNYPFGVLLMLYALALVERDGALLLVAWALGTSTIIATAFLSTEVIELLAELFERFG